MNNNDLDSDLSNYNNEQNTSASQADNRNISEDLSDLNIQSTSTSEANEEFNIEEAIEDLQIIMYELTIVLEIIAGINTIEKFNDVLKYTFSYSIINTLITE
ncbi:unnamed protein product [Macrosiphum euphorbiae]|uniref:Uncharacterized protein n=1 Tax=Macrosiphum euphorbiae TaxID=13131 RepID=A0AAV0Y565_9HEMI|nr:unnamed protein product [Macrosiphum euphorbiae]